MEHERNSVYSRSDSSNSGYSSDSIRSTQSHKLASSHNSESGASISRSNSVSSERSVSSSRLLRTESQDSGSSGGSNRSRSPARSFVEQGSISGDSRGSTASLSYKSERSQSVKSRSREGSLEREDSVDSQEEFKLKKEQIQTINEGSVDIRDSGPSTSANVSSWLSDTAELQRGRDNSSERGNEHTIIISRSLMNNLGSVLVKTADLSSAVHRVVDMPLNGCVGGVRSFGNFLKDKKVCQTRYPQFSEFYKKEWAPVVLQVSDSLDDLFECKGHQDEAISHLVDQVDENFSIVNHNYGVIVEAVKAMEELSMELAKKKVSFGKGDSNLKYEIEKLNHTISDLQEQMPRLIHQEVKEEIRNQFRYVKKSLKEEIDGTEVFKNMLDLYHQFEKDMRKHKNSRADVGKYQNLLPPKDSGGVLNRINLLKHESHMDILDEQNSEVGDAQTGNVFVNALSDNQQNIPLEQVIDLPNISQLNIPSESLPLVAEFKWSVDNPSGVEIQSLNFPECMMVDNEYIKRDLDRFAYFACESLEIVISTTSVMMHGGHLGVSWDSMSVAHKCNVVHSIPLSNNYTISIPAGESVVRSLKVPFISLQSLLAVTGKRRGLVSMGTLKFHVLNALRSPQEAAQEIPIKVYVRFINPTYLIQTIIHETFPAAVVNETPVTNVPVVSKSVVTPSPSVTKSVPQYSISNPFKVYSERYYSPYSSDPVAEEWNRAYDAGKIIKRDCDSIQVYPDVGGVLKCGGMEADFDYKPHVRENVIHLGEWKSSDTGMILHLSCSPTEFVRKDKENFYMPSLCQMAALFKHWRGSLIYSFTFGANAFTRGRVKIASVPECCIMSNPTYSQIMKLPGANYDLSTSERTVEVVVPFNNINKYHYTNLEYFGDTSYHGEMILTKLYMFVVDNLMTNIAANEAISYYVTVRPGDDFEFVTPIGINMGYPHTVKVQVDGIEKSGEDKSVGPEQSGASGKQPGTKITPRNVPYLREGYLFSDKLSGKENITFNVGPVLQRVPLCDNPTSWLSSMHVRWRGSLQYEFIVSGHNVMQEKGAYIYYIPYGYETTDDVTKHPNYMPSAGHLFHYWNFRDSPRFTMEVDWSSPLHSLLVADAAYGEEMPDRMMFNGRICVSFVGHPTDFVDIVCYIKPGENFQLFDHSYLKVVGKSTPKVMALTQYKLIRSVDELPIDKSDYVMSMPWPVLNTLDSTKKLAPVSGEVAEYKKADGEKAKKDFLDELSKAREKARKTKSSVQVDEWTRLDSEEIGEEFHDCMQEVYESAQEHPEDQKIVLEETWSGKVSSTAKKVFTSVAQSAAAAVIGEENLDALKSSNKIVEDVKQVVNEGNSKKLNDFISGMGSIDFGLIASMMEKISPLVDKAELHMPSILEQTDSAMPDVHEGFQIFNQLGSKVLEWATTLIDSSFPGWITQIREQQGFVLSMAATILGIILLVWWYKGTNKQSLVTKILTLLALLWAPLIGTQIYKFSQWLFMSFKTDLNSLLEYLTTKGIFPKDNNDVIIESIASQSAVADIFDEQFSSMFSEPLKLLQPILMISMTLTSLLSVGKIPSGKDAKKMQDSFSSFAQRAGQITTMVKFLELIKTYSQEMGPKMMRWMCEMCGYGIPDDVSIALGVNYKIKDWLKDVNEYSLEENLHKHLGTLEGREKIRQLYKQSTEIQQAIIDNSIKNFRYTLLLSPAFLACKKMMDEIHKSKGKVGVRVDPFMLVLMGAPGGGKSSTTEMIVNDICDALDLPKEDRTYSRNAGSDHWNGYDHQPVIVYDDLGCVAVSGQASDISEIINVKSNCPYEVPMASIEEKGKYCTSEIVIASTNMNALDDKVDIRRKGAFYRRRNVMVEVTRTSEKNPDDLEEGLSFQLIELDPEGIDKENGATVKYGPPMCYDCFMKYVVSSAMTYLDKQRRFIRSVNERKNNEGRFGEMKYQDVYAIYRSVCGEVGYTPHFKPGIKTTSVDTRSFAQVCKTGSKTDVMTDDTEEIKPGVFDLKARVVRHKSINQLIWPAIYDYYPHLIDTFEGVWFKDHEEFYIVTPSESLPVVLTREMDMRSDKCMTSMMNDGSIAGLCNFQICIPDLDLSIYEGVREEMGLLHPSMRLTDEQYALFSTLKGYTRITPQYFLMMMSLFDHVYQKNERERRSSTWNEIHDKVEEAQVEYDVQEKTWLQRCSKNMKIAIAVGASFLAVGAIAGAIVGLGKIYRCFNPTEEKVLHEEILETACELTVDHEEILVPQVGAGGMSGDLKTRYAKMGRRVLAKKVHAVSKQQSAEEIDWEAQGKTIQKIHVIAQNVGATKQELSNAQLYKFTNKELKDNLEYVNGLDNCVKSLCGEVQSCRSLESKKVIMDDTILFESPEGVVVLPKRVDGIKQVMGFDDQNKAVKGQDPAGLNRVDILKDVDQLSKAGARKKNKKIVKTTKRAHAQLKSDKMSHDIIRNTVKDALAEVYLPVSHRRGYVVRVFGSVIIFPVHYLYLFEKEKQFDFITSTTFTRLEFDTKRVIQYTQNQDIIAYDCGNRVPLAADIRSHFVTKEDFAKYKSCPGYLVSAMHSLDGVTLYVDHTPRITAVGIDQYPSGTFYDVKGKTIEDSKEKETFEHGLVSAFQYPMHTIDGSCGSLLVRDSPMEPRKIIGMHVAANSNYLFGYAEAVFQDDLNNLYNYVAKVSGPIVTSGVKDLPEDMVCKSVVEADMGEYIELTIEYSSGERFEMDTGCAPCLGEFPKNLVPRDSGATTIIKSPIHDTIASVQTEPSILNAYDHRLKENEYHENLVGKWSPLVDGVSKYGHEVKSFKPEDVKTVENFLKVKLKNKDNSEQRRQILTDEEIVNGIRGSSYWLPIDMSTSPGYPYILSRPSGEKGKQYLFKEIGLDENNCPIWALNDAKVKQNFILREKAAKEGKTYETVMVENVKDERRKLKKIYEKPATRTFTCLPLDLNMAYRKYFLDFAVMVMELRHELFCKVGINPDSLEWSRLYHQLNDSGPNGFAGDYGKFDGIGMPDIYMSIVNCVNDWYDDGNDLIRKTLITETFHRFSLCGGEIFRIDQGMPSGFPMTVIFNSFMNYYYLALAWMELTKDWSFEGLTPMEAFNAKTEIATYGDDNVVAVNDDIIEVYNLRSVSAYLAKFGITYTDDQKRPIEESEPYVPIIATSFLKRTFKRFDKGGYLMMAPLDKVSITEQLNWLRKGQESWDALKDNAKGALYEAMHHGELYYDELKEALSVVFKAHCQDIEILNYTDQLLRWWQNITKMSCMTPIMQKIARGELKEGCYISALRDVPEFPMFKTVLQQALAIPPVAFEVEFPRIA